MSNLGTLSLQGGLGARVADLASSSRANEAAELARASDAGQVADAAQKFEKLFATVLVKEMRKSLSDGFFGKGPGADVFSGWLDEHVGGALAASGDLDIAGFIKVNLGAKQASGESQEFRS
jgi:Rod binding domain-containing protein